MTRRYRPVASRWVILFLCGFVSLAVTANAQTPWFSTTVESKNGIFLVTFESTQSEFALNEFRTWHLVLQDKHTGAGVSPARFSIGGGMPMHGHGLPSQPQVAKHLGDGRYVIDGVRFNMLGKWLFEFDIATKDASDSVSFEVIVDY
ncbi:MAG: FixH family protein [Pseudomonadota bacterium]